MTTFCETLNVGDFKRGCGDSFAKSLFYHWNESGGGESPNHNYLVEYSPRLLILGKPRNERKMGNLIFAGTDAFATKLLGEKWASEPISNNKMMACDYGEVVSQNQTKSLESGEPIYDLIASHIDEKSIIYERLLLPVKTAAGQSFLMCYSMGVDVQAKDKFGSTAGYRSS